MRRTAGMTCAGRTTWTTAAVGMVAMGLAVAATAQPPDGFDGSRPGRGPGGPPGDGRPHRDPLREALDTNHDHRLDADEIKNASAALMTLDKDGDGIVSHDELRPMGPPNREGRGFDGGPRRGRGGADGSGGDGPGRPPENRGRGPEGRGPEAGRGPGGQRGPGPSPEAFIDRLMSFDADGDGKLDRDELRACAEQMGRPRGGRGGPPGPAGGPPEPPSE